MTNLFKKLVFTDKAIDDLTVAVQAGKSITVERAVLSGWTPPDDDQVYTPYKNSSGALDVAAVKANINKYFDKNEALKNTAPAWVEGILKSKTVKQENKNTLNFALDFENTDFDHDVAAKYYGYTSWAELLDNMSEFNIDAQSVALLAQDDTGLEYVFAFAKIESDDSLKYPAALTTELTHKLHIDLFINITQSDNIIIKYIPEGLVEYSEFEQHVANAEDVYAKKIDVYTKVESDNSFLTKSDAAATYTTKIENAKKANSSDVYTKVESDGRFARNTTVNGLIIKTNEIESGVINNTRAIRILSHDGKSLATHANETITARTEYIKTDSTLSDYGAVANAGKVGEAIKQTFLILNASIARLVVDYNSLQSNQVIIDLANKILALKKSVEITSEESQKDNLDALHDTGRYYLGEAKGYSDAILEVATLGNTNKIMQYIYSAGNNPNRAERRIGTKNGNTYSWSEWSAEY